MAKKKKLTRQREEQIALKAKGKCIKCRKRKLHSASYCELCTVEMRQYHRLLKRKKLGCKPWKKGKPGRPPKKIGEK